MNSVEARLVNVFYFFFSSRRRHTRFDCDWSSDVCSSDLVRRWLSQVGEYADDLLVLPPARIAPISLLPKVVASIRAAQDPLTLQDLAVNGNDLIAAGVRPGPDVGEVLQRLLALVLEDPQRNTKEYLLSRV